MKTVLLTGAAGFVGRQVHRALRQRGMRVRAVVRTGSERTVGSTDCEAIVATPDLFAQDDAWWTRACAGADAVVHAAWYAQPGLYLQSPANLDCLAGTLQLAKGAAAAGVQRFVGIGTCFEYDLAHGVLAVDTPLRPASPYAAAKAAAFLALSQWLPLQGVSFAWCRLFYLHGEGEDPRRLVPHLRSRLSAGQPAELTSGRQLRDYLDVRDAGRMITDVVVSDRTGPVNICSGVAVTVRELAEKIADEYGRRDLLRFGARPENPVDPPKVVGVPDTEGTSRAAAP